MDWGAFGSFASQAGPFLTSLVLMVIVLVVVARNFAPAMAQAGKMWQTANDALVTSVDLLRTEVVRLNEGISERDKTISKLRDNRDDLLKRVEQLEGQEAARALQMDQLAARMAEAEKQAASKEAELVTLRAEVADLRSEDEAKRAKISALEAQVKKMEADRNKVAAERDRAEQRVAELEAKLAGMAVELEALRAKVNHEVEASKPEAEKADDAKS